MTAMKRNEMLLPLIVILGILIAVFWLVQRSDGTDSATEKNVLGVTDLLSDPASYSGTSVCVDGFVRLTSAFTGMADEFVEQNGVTALTGAILWLDGYPSNVEELSCDDYNACTGQMTVCGTFESGGSYGKDGFYSSQMTPQ